MVDRDIVDFLSPATLRQLRTPGVQLAEQLRRLMMEVIGSGRAPPGTKLPSIRTLASRASIAPDTVAQAYRKLVSAGAIEAVRGSGFYVALTRDANLPAPSARQSETQIFGHRSARTWLGLSGLDRAPELMPGSALIHPQLGAAAFAAKALRSSLRTRIDTLSTVGDREGYLPLRHQIQRKLAREGIACQVENILTANGATGALSLIMRAFVRPRDYVLIEDPHPVLHRELLLSQGAWLLHVPRGEAGPDLTVVRELCEQYRPVLFLCSSGCQNPTGGSIAPAVAHELLRTADEFGLRIVDDTSYAELRPPTEETLWMPLAALGGSRQVVHVGSFSRVLAPALGVGYLVANPMLADWIRPYTAIHGASLGQVAERAVYQLIEDGLYDRRRRLIASQVADDRRRVLSLLSQTGLPLPSAGAGLFLWTSLGDGVDANELARRLTGSDVLLADPALFSASPAWRSFTRLNASMTNQQTIRLIIDRM